MTQPIYNGFRVHYNDVDAFVETLPSFAEKYAELAANKKLADIMKLTIRKVDATGSDFSATLEESIAEIRKAAYANRTADYVMPAHPFDYSCSVYMFILDGYDYNFFMVASSDQNVVAAFHEITSAEPFSYFPGTNTPDHLTDAEWDERRQVWEALQDGGFEPQEMKMEEPKLTLTTDKLANSMPTDKDRAIHNIMTANAMDTIAKNMEGMQNGGEINLEMVAQQLNVQSSASVLEMMYQRASPEDKTREGRALKGAIGKLPQFDSMDVMISLSSFIDKFQITDAKDRNMY